MCGSFVKPTFSPEDALPPHFPSTGLCKYRPTMLYQPNGSSSPWSWKTHTQTNTLTHTHWGRHTQLAKCEHVSEKTNKLQHGSLGNHDCCCFISARPDLQQLPDIPLLHRWLGQYSCVVCPTETSPVSPISWVCCTQTHNTVNSTEY